MSQVNRYQTEPGLRTVGHYTPAGYIQARDNGQPHDKAARDANSVVTKVRRALGYTLPGAGRVNF